MASVVDVEAIAALCARSLDWPPSAAELQGALLSREQPCVVQGSPSSGVVATTVGLDDASAGFVRLLVVDPACRGRGVGRGLLASAEDVLRSSGATSVQIGADPPWWLYPGVPSSSTALLCLLEASGYQRVDTTFDMAVPLPVDDGSAAVAEGVVLGGTSDRDQLDRWLAAEWPGWRTEALRALDRSTLVLRRDASGIAGVCAWSVSRDGVLGPVAVRGSLVGRGVGRALVVEALRHMASEGRSVAEVGWVGPIRPYAAVGGHVSRLFFVYRKSLRP